MFKTSVSWLVSCLTLYSVTQVASASQEPTTLLYKPLKISYASLLHTKENEADHDHQESQQLLSALKSVGMVSLTDIPGMRAAKAQALTWDLHACAVAGSASQHHLDKDLEDSLPSLAKHTTFADGTVRRTMATHTVNGHMQNLMDRLFRQGATISSSTSLEPCERFAAAADALRPLVDDATQAFAQYLTRILQQELGHSFDEQPMLRSREPGECYSTLADVVASGEHLEHFHSYQKISAMDANTDKTEGHPEATKTTIELHTDQGLLLAFIPGRMVNPQVSPEDNEDSTTWVGTRGFYIELPDKSLAEVYLDEDVDLVFVLGDGVHQYINPRLVSAASMDLLESPLQLRATPHALVLPSHTVIDARVWYGRMVLPPADALHPAHPDRTLGELQNLLKSSSPSDEHLSLGCSSNLVARHLEESINCEDDTLYCWHRCMNLTEYGVSEEVCAAQNLQLQCINPRRQLWDNTHGDFFPDCIDTATAVVATPFPRLPDYPRANETCTPAAWEAFVDQEASNYEHSFDLKNGAIFQWSVIDQEQVIQGRLLYNGLFGYLSFGFAGLNGAKNGMHGAMILMALPGGNYSAVTGLDLTLESTIGTYVIDPDGGKSSFRFWMEPTFTSESRSTNLSTSPSSSSSMDATECFTAMTFRVGEIQGQKFNLSGTDQLVWAANGIDSYVGYHGAARGRFSIDWPTAAGTYLDSKKETPPTAAAPTPPTAAAPTTPTAAAPTMNATEPSAAESSSFHMTMLAWKGMLLLGSTVMSAVGFL